MCTLCKFSSGNRANVTAHFISVHTSDKPHKCPFCDHRSSQKNNLKQHISANHEGLVVPKVVQKINT